jgi:ribonucleoside-diphosphate reductase alpha chain
MAAANVVLSLPVWAVAIVDDIAASFARSPEESFEIATILGPNVTTRLPFAPNALKVVAKRYLRTDVDGIPIESPEQMFYRVAHALAAVERNYDHDDEFVDACECAFFECMARFEFAPAGRTLTNAGALTDVVANCIVLHIDDSMDGIFTTLREAALLQKAGSGLGFPFHQLRPAGTRTVKSGGESSGPVSFLHVYNAAFGVIKQQNRHGANMGVMSVEHPDILEFIHCKEIEGDIKNFNISVGFTDRFMTAVVEKSPLPWKCMFGGKEYDPRRIVRDKNYTIVSITPCVMTAAEIFEEIIRCAWKNGEPGCLFLDTVNKVNPLPGLGRIEASNPCGEQVRMVAFFSNNCTRRLFF